MRTLTPSDLLRQAADVFRESGNPLAEYLRPHLLASLKHPVKRVPNRVRALAHLDDALAAPDAHPIVDTISCVENALRWLDAKAMQELEATRDRHAYAEVVGPDGLFSSQIVRFGLYFQSADTVYPDHRHAAEELYFVVSGTAQWRKGGVAFAAKAPGTLIHHRSLQTHATTTLAQPLLAMWAWAGDISPDSYEVSGVPGL